MVVPAVIDAATRGAVEEVESALSTDPACAKVIGENGRSALSLAAQKGHAKVVKMLLDSDAVDTAVCGWTSVHHAAFGGHAEVLSAIAAKLGAGALAPSGSCMPPLLLAANKGHVACLTALLDAAPATLNEAVDAHGRTALMCAASSGSAEAVELLAARGANLDAISSCGKTALMWAVCSHKPATVEALARLGADPSIAQPVGELIIPGQDRSKGENAEDLSNGRNGKDPTLRHIGKFMHEWRKAREAGSAVVPAMPPLPWVQHAVEEAAKAEEEAKAAAEKAAAAADEPLIEEVGEAAASAAADDNDIFGDVSDAAPVPVGGEAQADDAAAVKAEAEAAAKSMAADADLDELD